MRTINLLPKKPFWEAWFLPMLLGLIALYLLAGMTIWYGAWSAERGHEQNLDAIAEMRAEIQDLREDRVPDPLLATFESFQNVVATVEQSRKDWFPILHTMTSLLPASARIVSAEYSAEGEEDEGLVQIAAQFRSLNDVAEYVRIMRLSGEFDDVLVENITSGVLTQQAAAPGEFPGTSQDLADPDLSSDDPLLRELEWLIRSQGLEQQFGIDMPAENPYAAEPTPVIPELADAFEPEEIEAARAAAGRFQGPAFFTQQPSEEEIVPDIEIPFYNVELFAKLADAGGGDKAEAAEREQN